MGGMATFGLGIVLTVTDNATGKLTGVNSSLQQVSQTAMSLNYMGKSLMQTGMGMIKPIVGFGKELVRVNSDVEKTMITLGALYENADVGREKFQEIIKYAAETPFEVEELKDAAVTFKTLGLEIIGTGSEVTTTSGQTRQFMDVLGDLGSGLSGVARNGFKDVTYAVKEFVTEGNKLSFLRRLGIDIDSVLGKAGLTVADTVEGRLKNMADLAQILHFEGLTDKMFGTWSQTISNMDDVWYMFLMNVGAADTGLINFDEFGNTVFGGFERTLDKVSQLLKTVLTEDFAKSIAKSLTVIMQPLDWIASKLVSIAGGLTKLISNNPQIATLILGATALTAVLFLVAGAGLVAKSSLMLFKYGLMQVAGTLPMFAKWGLIFAGLNYAWSRDIGGMRTKLSAFANAVRDAFGIADEAMKKDTPDMIQTYKNLVSTFNSTGDLKSGLASKIMAFRVMWGGLIEFMTSPENKVSAETLDIIDQMGLMHTFEKLSIWAYRAKEFGKGVAEGLAESVNAVTNFAKKVATAFAKLPLGDKAQGLYDMFSGKFNVTGGDKFKSIGKMVSQAVLLIYPLKKLFGLFKLFGGSGNKTGGGIGGLLRKLFGDDSNSNVKRSSVRVKLQILKDINSIITSPKKAAKTLASLAILLVGMTGVVSAIGLLSKIPGDLIKNGAKSLLMVLGAMLPMGTPLFANAMATISKLANMKISDVGKGVLNLAIIVGAMALIVTALGGLASIPGNLIAKGTLAFYAICACLLPLSTPIFYKAIKTLQKLANFKWQTVLKGIRNLAIIMGGLAVLVAALGGVAWLLGQAGVDYGQLSLLALVILEVGVIGSALTYLMGKLKGIKLTDVVQPLLAMAGVLLALSGVLWVVNKLNGTADAGQLAKIGLVILEFGVIGAAVTFIASVMGAVVKGAALDVVVGILAIGGVLIAMAGIMWVVNALTGSISAGQMAKVGVVMLEFAAVAGAISVIAGIIGGIIMGTGGIALAAIAIGVADIGGVLIAMAGIMWVVNEIAGGINTEQMSKVADCIWGLGKIGSALSGLAGLIGLIPFVAIWLGVKKIGYTIEKVADLAVSIDKDYGKKLDKIESGFKVVETIANGLGNAAGSFAGGIAEGFTNSLPTVGKNLRSFLGELTPALKAISEVSNEDTNKFGDTLKKIIEGLNAVKGFKSDGEKFAKKVTDMTDCIKKMKSFYTECAGLDSTGISNSEMMFNSLAKLNDNPVFHEGGLKNLIDGSVGKGLGKVGKGLAEMATSIKPFYTACAGLDASSFSKAEQMFESLKVINDQAFMNGGVNDFWNGEIDLSNLGTMLSNFATTAGSFWTSIATWDETAFSKAQSMFTALKVINDQAFMNGGANDFWNGKIDLTNLGTMLSNFATKAETFFTKIQSFKNPERVGILFNALLKVKDLNSISTFNLATLGTNLSSFMTNAKGFFEGAAGVNVESMNSFAEGLSNFFTTVQSIVVPSMESMNSSVATMNTTLASIYTIAMQVGQSMILIAQYSQIAGVVIVQSFNSMATGMSIISVSAIANANIVIQAFMLMAMGSAQYSALIIQNFLLMAQGVQTSAVLVQAGMIMMYSAVLAGSALIISAIASMCAMVQSQLSALASSGYSYGSALASSIAAGISANSGAIAAAVQSAISSAVSRATINIPKVNIGHNAKGTSNWAGGLTEINERGGELIDLPRGTRIYPHDKSVTMAFDEGVQTAFDTIARNSNRGGDSYDDSVHFSAGSIVIYAQNTSNEEAERFAEMIMQKIERKKRRKALATYAY